MRVCGLCPVLQCVCLGVCVTERKRERRLISSLRCVVLQGVSVVEQEKLDKMMIEMDGTENKCK